MTGAAISPSRSRWVAAALTALLLCMATRPAWGQAATPSTERKIQAVFLLNFARFVEWPAAAFASAETPVCIGVLGVDPYGSLLDATVRGETIRGHAVVIRRSRTAEPLRDCHIVFMSRSEAAQEGQHLAALLGRPILTVSEVPGFAQRGGVLNFFVERDRVRFEISRAAAELSGLKINPQLLRLARILAATNESRMHAARAR